jgi:hypothetical protein
MLDLVSVRSRVPALDAVIPLIPGRAGELHEPVDLGAADRRALDASAALARLHPSLALALALERRALVEDLPAPRRAGAAAVLDERAASARVTVELGAADAAHLHTLVRRGAPSADTASAALWLPVRLVVRADVRRLAPWLAHEAIEQAVGWEVSATLAGRTMTEWALAVLLERALA